MLKGFMIIVTFHFLNIQVQSRYLYIKTKLTWADARDRCHTSYNGTLAASPLDGANDIKTCVKNDEFWTGIFSEVSSSISIEGCFNTTQKPTIIMGNNSVQACQKYCRALVKSSSTFAISRNRCICNVTRDTVKQRVSDNKCNITCDQIAYCGGPELFTLYKSTGTQQEHDFDELCDAFSCDSGELKTESKDCQEKYRAICVNITAYDKTVNWTDGMYWCLSSYQRYLLSVKNDSICRQNVIKDKKVYWNGSFRSQRFRRDKALSGSPKWDSIIPATTQSLKAAKNGYSDKMNEYNKKELPALCQSSDYTPVDPVDKDIVCSLTMTSETTTTIKSSTTVTTKTSTTPTSLFPTTDVSTTSITSTGKNTFLTKDFQQDQYSLSKAGIIGIVVGGMAVLSTTMVMITVFWLRSRFWNRQKNRRTKQHSEFSIINNQYKASMLEPQVEASLDQHHTLDNHQYTDICSLDNHYFVLENAEGAVSRPSEKGSYFVLEKNTNGQFSFQNNKQNTIHDVKLTGNLFVTQDQDNYALMRDSENDYDHLNLSESINIVPMVPDDIYSHSKPPRNEDSAYDKVHLKGKGHM